jgi:hypothetical protein
MNPSNLGTFKPQMNLDPIRKVLGDKMPQITNSDGHPTPLGRFRLVSALRNQFGDSYSNIPSARSALDHFDSEHEYFQKLRRIQGGY